MQCDPTTAQGIIFSDMVIREAGTGKTSLIGCFTAFNAPRFPFQTPPFFVTSYITNLRGKFDSLSFTFRFEDPNSGHVLTSVSAALRVPAEAPVVAQNQVFDIAVQIPPFVITSAGEYSVVVLVNNDKAGQRNLTVRALSSQSQAPSP